MNVDLCLGGVISIVVTYNRKNLLSRCLESIYAQRFLPNFVLVVDNFSSDGTEELLREEGWTDKEGFRFLRLERNTGGAGGFTCGMRYAVEELGVDWFWLMDDDAAPHPSALEELSRIAVDPSHVYGSLAVWGDETAWTTTVLEPPLGVVAEPERIPNGCVVESLPFLGFMIHRRLVEHIGLPDAGFFIAADDAEYCLRARRAGANIVLAPRSRIEHPRAQTQYLHVLGRTIAYLALPPWKRYYDTRNRLLIARKYHGSKLLTHTIPGSFVRLFAALAKEPNKLAQAHAFLAGFIDGVLGIKGKRHEKWGIKQ